MDRDRHALRERLFEWEEALSADACEAVREEDWGRLLTSPATPLIWDANRLILERDGLAMGEVVELAERELGGRGLDHRMVLVRDEAEGVRLAAEAENSEFEGWGADRFVYMVWAGEAMPAPAATTHEARLDEIVGLRRASFVGELAPGDPDPEESAEQMLAHWGRIGEVGGDRWFVAEADGEPAGSCRLLRRDGIGQVEDVIVLDGARGRGLGGAITLAALAASRAAGDELTFIVAEADGRARELYRRLGFEPVGTATALRRLPGPAPA